MTETEALDEACKMGRQALIDEAFEVDPFGPRYDLMKTDELERLHVNLRKLEGKLEP